MTVSRVLNTPDRVAPETAERVRLAIEQLGYVPNLLAGGLSSRKSRIIAAIVPTVASPIFAGSLNAFTDEMDAAGYHVVLGLTGYGTEEAEEALVAAILGRRPDGLLLTGTEHSDATRRRLAVAGVPVVEIWEMTDHPSDMVVGFDHHAVGAAVAKLYLSQGYRRFAAIGADDPRAVARRRGFTDNVPREALILDLAMPAPASMQAGRDAVRHLVLGNEPVGLFCSSDLAAAGAVIEAGVRGIAVPQQLAVCGFGDLEVGRVIHPAISTVSVDGAEIGRTAARCLVSRLSGEDAPRRVEMPFQVVERGSTRSLHPHSFHP
jgi:LacI family gluconate utilization system Gnt-I transcriptional repressor